MRFCLRDEATRQRMPPSPRPAPLTRAQIRCDQISSDWPKDDSNLRLKPLALPDQLLYCRLACAGLPNGRAYTTLH